MQTVSPHSSPLPSTTAMKHRPLPHPPPPFVSSLTDKLLNQLASTVSATLRSVSSRNGSLYSTLCAVCCPTNAPRMLNGRCESLSRHLPTRWGGYRPESVYGYTPPAKGTRASVSIPRGGQCPCYRSEQGTSRRACPPSYGSVSDVTRIVQ